MPAVVTLMPLTDMMTQDGVPVIEACSVLEERGADVVGFNCSRGLDTMVTSVKELRKVCKVKIDRKFHDI